MASDYPLISNTFIKSLNDSERRQHSIQACEYHGVHESGYQARVKVGLRLIASKGSLAA